MTLDFKTKDNVLAYELRTSKFKLLRNKGEL